MFKTARIGRFPNFSMQGEFAVRSRTFARWLVREGGDHHNFFDCEANRIPFATTKYALESRINGGSDDVTLGG